MKSQGLSSGNLCRSRASLHKLLPGLLAVPRKLRRRELLARQAVADVPKDGERLRRHVRHLGGLAAWDGVRPLRKQHELTRLLAVRVRDPAHRVHVAEHAVEDAIRKALGHLAAHSVEAKGRHERGAGRVQGDELHALCADSHCLGALVALRSSLLRAREKVGPHQRNDEHCKQEDGELEGLVHARQGDLREVDDDHCEGLTDVFLHRVKRLQQIHGTDGLHDEGEGHHPRHPVPVREEAIFMHLALGRAHQHRSKGPGSREAGDLREQRHVCIGLQVLLGQHRAVAGHGHLEQHSCHCAKRNGPSTGAA
mmetsp:Transcript_78328/g.201681  ORF Transcript_78328/g.201681 Transcript_78328/m.201681 type:complete len:310 (+) Transcript_78328:317-1246(+)